MLRGLPVVVAALAVAGVVTPALSAADVSRQIAKVGGKLFVEETDLVRVNVPLQIGEGGVVIRSGPLKLTAHCIQREIDGDGPPAEVVAFLRLRTTLDNAAFDSDGPDDDDLDVADGAPVITATFDDPGVVEQSDEDVGLFHAAAPDGTRLSTRDVTLIVNQGGVACRAFGSFLMMEGTG